jgi:hypothetical protein
MTVTLSNSTNAYCWRDRPATDFFETPKDVTRALLAFLQLDPNNNFLWDCACGKGMMTEVFEEMGFTFLGTDIQKGGQDFLTTAPPLEENIWIITNPPFVAAERFIQNAFYLKRIKGFAFLLKSQYWHSAKRNSLFYETIPKYVLPLSWRPDFLFGSKSGSPTMEVLWTVWEIGNTKRTIYQPLAKPRPRSQDRRT